MITKRKIALASACFILAASHALSQEVEVPEDYNAETMLKLCKGEVSDMASDMQSFICTFRIQGVSSMSIENCLSVEQGFQPVPYLSSARPPSRGAARQAFFNFMEDNPKAWNLPWHQAVALSLAGSFPCENLEK